MKTIYFNEYPGITTPVLIAAVLITAVIFIFMLASICAVYRKAGEPGWKAIIPVYNTYTLFKFAWDVRFFWLLIGMTLLCYISVFPALLLNSIVLAVLAAIIGFIILIIVLRMFHQLSKAFGHGIGYTIGILFLPVIFIPLLAFGKSRYIRR